MKKSSVLIALIAACAHDLNRAYCAAMGDDTQLPWSEAAKWQKDSVIAGVEMHLANPDATPEQSHESWLDQKTKDGWKYGKKKDEKKKEHPCFLPYAELPAEQKAKDYIFRQAVHSISAAIDTAESLAPVTTTSKAEIDPSLKGVKFIHKSDEWVDQIYGTGLIFKNGQTRYLPLEVALKLLRHQDLFAAPDADDPAPTSADSDAVLDAAKAETKRLHDEENAFMDLHDSVAQMGKDELAHFALSNFQQTLDKRQSVDKLRTETKEFIDRFGRGLSK